MIKSYISIRQTGRTTLLFALSIFIVSAAAFGQERFRVYSTEVADSFDIYVLKGSLDPGRPVRFVTISTPASIRVRNYGGN